MLLGGSGKRCGSDELKKGAIEANTARNDPLSNHQLKNDDLGDTTASWQETGEVIGITLCMTTSWTLANGKVTAETLEMHTCSADSLESPAMGAATSHAGVGVLGFLAGAFVVAKIKRGAPMM